MYPSQAYIIIVKFILRMFPKRMFTCALHASCLLNIDLNTVKLRLTDTSLLQTVRLVTNFPKFMHVILISIIRRHLLSGHFTGLSLWCPY